MRFSTDRARLVALLEWIVDRGEGSHSTKGFYESSVNAWKMALDDFRWLKDRGYVTGHSPGADYPMATSTADGRSHVEELRAARSSSADRRWACRMSLLEWLDSLGAVGESKRVDWGKFYGDIRNDYFGQPFTLEDVEAASAWLWRNNYIEGLGVHDFDGPAFPYLSDQGLECVERFGADPRRHEKANNRPREGDTFNLAGDNTQVSTGDNVTQVMNIGASAEELRDLLNGLVDFVLTLASPDEAADLEELRNQAIADLQSPNSTGQPAIRLGQRIKAVAYMAGGAALGATVTLAVNGLFSDMARLVH